MSCSVYLALGSNIGDREKNLDDAIINILKIQGIQLINISNIYETDPVGYTEQEKFLNMVIDVYTDLEPLDLLHKLQGIEAVMKRTREMHWGPRTIDIDILVYGSEKINLTQLVIPHTRMFERAFVLIPLKDIYPDRCINGFGIDELIEKCKDRTGVRLYRQIECRKGKIYG